jgi:hypothetical protein
MKHIIVLFILTFSLYIAYAGDDGKKVLDINLNQKYEGKCKRGLAHGKGKAWGEKDYYEGKFKKGLPHGYGIYKWGNGNVYEGNFVRGKMDGKGELISILPSGEKKIQKGYFRKGKYIGKYIKPYKVILKQGIRKVQFRENGIGDLNEVRIMAYADGRLIDGDLIITDMNNTMVENTGEGSVLTNIQFPLKKVEVTFKHSVFSYRLIFNIYKKGNWEIIISV